MLPNSLCLNTSSVIFLYFCALYHLLPFYVWPTASALIISLQRFKTFLSARAPSLALVCFMEVILSLTRLLHQAKNNNLGDGCHFCHSDGGLSRVFRLVTPCLWWSGCGSRYTRALQSHWRREKCLLFRGEVFHPS